MAIKINNVGLNSIRLSKGQNTHYPSIQSEYSESIDASTIDTNKITGNYTISDNTINFDTTAYYNDSSYNVNVTQPYTFILLENTTSRSSTYFHYISFGEQSIGSFKAVYNSNSNLIERYYYSHATGILNLGSGNSREVFLNRWGLHIITVDENRMRWITYWEGRSPTFIQHDTNILKSSEPRDITYAYGYGSEHKKSQLRELSSLQRTISTEEEHIVVDGINAKYSMNIIK